MPAPASEAALHLRNGRDASRVVCSGCGQEYFFIRSYTQGETGGNLAPCPVCGRLSAEMVAEAREQASFVFWMVALIVGLLCVPFFFLAIFPEAMQQGWGMLYQTTPWKFHLLWAGLGLTALCCLLALAMPWLYDPNRAAHQARRIQRGQFYSLLPEQLAAARQRAEDPVTLSSGAVDARQTFYSTWNGQAFLLVVCGVVFTIVGLWTVITPEKGKMYIGALVVGPILVLLNFRKMRDV